MSHAENREVILSNYIHIKRKCYNKHKTITK
nr:MAG TPA: hypothetical protein [Caudoviricetes sp.]